MRKISLALLLALPGIAHAADPTWPPEPLMEMRVPTAPTAFPSAGRTYLVYEVRLTNLGKSALGVRRLEVRDEDNLSAAPIAGIEAEQLDKV